MTAENRKCPVTGCRNNRPRLAAMCRRCWYGLPLDVRADVIRLWTLSRRPTATPDDRIAHIAAVRIAVDLAARRRGLA